VLSSCQPRLQVSGFFGSTVHSFVSTDFQSLLPRSARGTNCLKSDTPCSPFCFQQLPTVKFCNSFLLITIRIARGGSTPSVHVHYVHARSSLAHPKRISMSLHQTNLFSLPPSDFQHSTLQPRFCGFFAVNCKLSALAHVSSLECAVTQFPPVSLLECAVTKMRRCKYFRMRSYKKR
jgi:hypothetical protein